VVAATGLDAAVPSSRRRHPAPFPLPWLEA
jgi:hypothetical protein